MTLKKQLGHSDITLSHPLVITRFARGFIARYTAILLPMDQQNNSSKQRFRAQAKTDLDPRLVELVKYLAHAAAKRDYERLRDDGRNPPGQGDEQ